MYSVCDSEFELVATTHEPPTRISLNFDERTQGNGYSTLAQMVSTAESRRRACLFGTSGRAEKATPSDPTTLFKVLPQHLKTALSPAPTKEAAGPNSKLPRGSPREASVAMATSAPQAGLGLKSPRRASTDKRADGAVTGKSGEGAGEKAPPPLSILTTPYLGRQGYGQ